MARSGRDHNLDDQRQPVTRPLVSNRPTEDERSSLSGGDQSSGRQNSLPTPVDSRPQPGRSGSQRMPYREPERDRAYALRDSEIRTLAEIGTFRAVTLDDLTRYRYGGNIDAGRRDLENLDCEGLIRRRTTYPEHAVYL